LDGKIDPNAACRRHRVRSVDDRKQSFAAPITQTIDLYRKQLDLRPIAQLRHTVAEKSGEGGDVVLKLRQPARFYLAEAAFRDDETALPVIAAIEQHKQLAMLEKTERLLRIILFFRDAHPEHVDRHAKLVQLETGASVSRRVSPVSTDDEVRAQFYFATWSFCAHANYSLILNQQIDDFGLHKQLECREPFGMTGEKVKKIPLRHERDEFAARRELREIGERYGLTIDDTAQFPYFLVRLLQELIEQPEFLH